MPISGRPGRPTTQGKNERSHQTLKRFLDANRPGSLDEVRTLITRYREHYNLRRPHQALGQSAPAQAWALLEYTPASEPIAVEVLEARASQYRQQRHVDETDLRYATVTVSKSGRPLPDHTEVGSDQAANQSIVEVTVNNRQVYYLGYHVSLPAPFAGRKWYRTITDEEFLLSDIDTGEVVFSFPLPMVALRVRSRYVLSYSIQGVQMTIPSKAWAARHAEFLAEFEARERELPETFTP